MIHSHAVFVCAMMLTVAGVMEIAASESSARSRAEGMLCALGFLMLGVRLFYLVATDSIDRLHIFGIGSIAAIALWRIMACAAVLREKIQ